MFAPEHFMWSSSNQDNQLYMIPQDLIQQDIVKVV